MAPSDGSFVPGPIEPTTHRGRSGVANPEATSFAMRAAASLSSKVFSGIAYSDKKTGNDPKVAVSTASTPTSKNSRCISAMTSGRVSTTCSLQPSSSGPPKSSGPRSWSCTHVPKAPSKIRTRSRRAARKSDMGEKATGASPVTRWSVSGALRRAPKHPQRGTEPAVQHRVPKPGRRRARREADAVEPPLGEDDDELRVAVVLGGRESKDL